MSMAATRAAQMRCTFCSTLFSTTKRCTVVACICGQQHSTGNCCIDKSAAAHSGILLVELACSSPRHLQTTSWSFKIPSAVLLTPSLYIADNTALKGSASL